MAWFALALASGFGIGPTCALCHLVQEEACQSCGLRRRLRQRKPHRSLQSRPLRIHKLTFFPSVLHEPCLLNLVLVVLNYFSDRTLGCLLMNLFQTKSWCPSSSAMDRRQRDSTALSNLKLDLFSHSEIFNENWPADQCEAVQRFGRFKK